MESPMDLMMELVRFFFFSVCYLSLCDVGCADVLVFSRSHSLLSDWWNNLDEAMEEIKVRKEPTTNQTQTTMLHGLFFR